MTSPTDPLTLLCGQVLHNRLMKARRARRLPIRRTHRMSDWSGLYRRWRLIAPALDPQLARNRRTPAALTELDARGAITR